MSGPSQNTYNTQNSVMQEQLANSQQQNQLEQNYLQFAQQQFGLGQQLEQPLISKLQGLASGDPAKVLAAAGPEVGNIAQAGQAAKANIMNTTQPGAGQEFALAQVPMQTNSQTASYLNNIINAAPQQMAQLGAAQTGVGLSLTGAGQGFGSLGVSQAGLSLSAAQQEQQAQAQQKASTMSFLGSLAGAAGTAAGGGAFGTLGG